MHYLEGGLTEHINDKATYLFFFVKLRVSSYSTIEVMTFTKFDNQ